MASTERDRIERVDPIVFRWLLLLLHGRFVHVIIDQRFRLHAYLTHLGHDLLWYGIAEVQFEPCDQLVERAKHLLSEAKPFGRYGEILVECFEFDHVGKHELARPLNATRKKVGNFRRIFRFLVDEQVLHAQPDLVGCARIVQIGQILVVLVRDDLAHI